MRRKNQNQDQEVGIENGEEEVVHVSGQKRRRKRKPNRNILFATLLHLSERQPKHQSLLKPPSTLQTNRSEHFTIPRSQQRKVNPSIRRKRASCRCQRKTHMPTPKRCIMTPIMDITARIISSKRIHINRSRPKLVQSSTMNCSIYYRIWTMMKLTAVAFQQTQSFEKSTR